MRAELPAVVYATLAELVAERVPEADEDVHFTRGVATAVLELLTDPGDVVLDPFAGFGTTLAVATDLGRTAVGVELLPERVAAIAARAPSAEVIEGDARGLRYLVKRRDIALCLTSPPYMTAHEHPANPLTAYETDDGDYRTYLRSLAEVLAQVAATLRPDGHVVLNVADIEHDGVRTPLVDDVAAAAGAVLPEIARVPVCWDEMPHDLLRDTLLVFAAPDADGGAWA